MAILAIDKAKLKEINKVYPCPNKQNPIFVRMWELFLPELVDRDNFRPAHLIQLEILCDLYSDYTRLRSVIADSGYTFNNDIDDTVDKRSGMQIKARPEQQMIKSIRDQIASYMKILGLVLVKDRGLPQVTSEEKWD